MNLDKPMLTRGKSQLRHERPPGDVAQG